MLERIIPFLKKPAAAVPILAFACLIPASAQPTPAPASGDLPCKEDVDVVTKDTVAGVPDAEGYLPLFDGSFKGWFQSCKTSHSNNSNEGAIFRIGQADGKPAIYSTQRGTSTGGVMMTNKKFTNYEITFQTWPDYGNDAGLFNRTPINGRCFQTVLDYIGGAAVGGAFGEGGFTSRDFRPYKFAGNEQSIAIPGLDGGNELNDWTIVTRKLKATAAEKDLPCSSMGCTANDWKLLWDFDGWMDIKIQFYGGNALGTGSLHMKSWFKKPASNVWVPILQDTTLNLVVAAGYIGIQVHDGGRFGGTKGTWYRNIRWKPISDNGIPVSLRQGRNASAKGPAPRFALSATGTILSGSIDKEYTIEFRDGRGRFLESFSGKAGAIRHAFVTTRRGLLFMRIATQGHAAFARIYRNPT